MTKARVEMIIAPSGGEPVVIQPTRPDGVHVARTESIADDLRSDIVAGVFPAGERLIELQLCER